MRNDLTVISVNFENHGKGDENVRRTFYGILREEGPGVVLVQEEWRPEVHESTEKTLGMVRVSPPESPCGIYVDSQVFEVGPDWSPTPGVWALQPAFRTLRLVGTSREAAPLIVGSFHNNYSSPSSRLAETEDLGRYIDKKWGVGGKEYRVPSVLGGDTNSPALYVDGGPPEMDSGSITDTPHAVHRSYLDCVEGFFPDTRPDRWMHCLGYHDVAVEAARITGHSAPVQATVRDSPTQGPGQRPDRVYHTAVLSSALLDVGVLPMVHPLTGGALTDHNALVVTYALPALTGILNDVSLHLIGA